MSHVYCPECGFQNPEAANYCSKCGAALVRDTGGADTTMAFEPEELEETAASEGLMATEEETDPDFAGDDPDPADPVA